MAKDKEQPRRTLMREGIKEGIIIGLLACGVCAVMLFYIYIIFYTVAQNARMAEIFSKFGG